MLLYLAKLCCFFNLNFSKKFIFFRTSLERMRGAQLKHGQSLLEYLITGFNRRFSHLLDNIDLLKAVAIHPRFRLYVVSQINKELVSKVKNELLAEALNNVSSLSVPLLADQKDGSNDADTEDDGFLHYKVSSQV